jgi:glycine hydroxymethyltransferase
VTFTTGQEHDAATLLAARELVAGLGGQQLADRVRDLVKANDTWRRRRCVNLIAAESPSSPMVRELLAAEVGTRASGGHIGAESRCFPGMRHIDEMEAVCIELLKDLFRAGFADQRLMGGMAGCTVAYAALASPGDVMMSVPLSAGGDSSGRADGPAGVRGLRIHDIPFDLPEFTVDLDAFRRAAERLRPALVSINQATTLFPLPVAEMAKIVADLGGRLYFDGAHQAGLIAGGCYPNPLAEGADLLSGSGGKTFSGPQSGIIAWNDERLSRPVVETIFPVLTGSHQLNRVAALAVAAAEMSAFGSAYMSRVVANAQALAGALHRRGLPVAAEHRGYTQTHQVLVDVRQWGGGLAVAQQLERANIMVNKMLLPGEEDDPGGIRIGTTEVTRFGMTPADMVTIAGFVHRVIVEGSPAARVAGDVADFRAAFQDLEFCFPLSPEPGIPCREGQPA